MVCISYFNLFKVPFFLRRAGPKKKKKKMRKKKKKFEMHFLIILINITVLDVKL